MNEKREKEAKNNFNNYLAENLIKKINFDENIYHKFYENALESLKTSNELFNNKTSFLWVVVTSYYSMFYMASAYIYKKGYKAQHKIVHKIINESLIIFAKDINYEILEKFEEEKEKALSIVENLLDNYEYEKAKRSRFQYEMTQELKENKAKTSLKRAKEFIQAFREILH